MQVYILAKAMAYLLIICYLICLIPHLAREFHV